MDNRNTGKLIASLRKKLGMTQQELGDQIGVGFRAVSKWERGLNLPDIGNMTELSKILGITLDELLAGKLNEKEEKTESSKKLSPKLKITITITLIIIASIITSIIYFNNKTYAYNISSTNRDEYIVKGQVTFKGKKINIIVNDLYFKDKEFSSTTIKDYEYKIISGETVLFGYGQNQNGNYLDQEKTIENAINLLKINYSGDTKISRQHVVDNNLIIVVKFIDNELNPIIKEIKFSLYEIQAEK